MSPSVRLKMVWPWKLSLARLALEGLHSCTETQTVIVVAEMELEQVLRVCSGRFVISTQRTITLTNLSFTGNNELFIFCNEQIEWMEEKSRILVDQII